MCWRKLESTFYDDPKIEDLAETLGITSAQAHGHIAVLWSWALRFAPGGDLKPSVKVIERGAKWEGARGVFLEAAIDVELIDKVDDGFAIHNWRTRGGTYAETAARRDRRRRAKGRRENDSPAQSTAPQDDASQQSCPQSFPQGDRAAPEPISTISRSCDECPRTLPDVRGCPPLEEKRREENRSKNLSLKNHVTEYPIARGGEREGDDIGNTMALSDLMSVEAHGYHRYGSMTPMAIPGIRDLLPISKDELNKALATPGRSWAYAAKVIETERDRLNAVALEEFERQKRDIEHEIKWAKERQDRFEPGSAKHENCLSYRLDQEAKLEELIKENEGLNGKRTQARISRGLSATPVLL